MTNRISRRAISCALLATTALVASPAFAAAPAPRFVNIDANGVDLTTGKVQFAFEEGGVGSGEGAVRFQRIFAQDAGFVDNFSGGMFDATVNGVTKTYVQIAGVSDVFTKSGTTFTSDNAEGSTLVYDSTAFVYRYTAADGTKIVFQNIGYYPEYSYSCPGADPQACHVPQSITKPNGLKVNFTWETGVMCYNIPNEPCASEKDYRRLTYISTSAGYSATIGYASSFVGTYPNANPDWSKRVSIGFWNSANPPSPAPAIAYGYPSSGVITITDPGNRQWRLTSDTSGRITGVRRPGSAADNITYAYGASGAVSSATKDGVTTTYARSVVGTTATETTTDPLSGQTVTISDLAKGRPTSFRDELNRTTAYEYDANGRPTKVTQPEGNNTQLTYDGRGNVTTTTNVAKPGTGLANIVTSASFDASCANVVTCNKPNSTTGAKGNVTTYVYDSTHGGLTSVTRPAVLVNGNTVNPQTRYSYTQVPSASGDQVFELTGVSACQTTSSCTGAADETKATVAYNSNLLPTSVTRANGTGTLSATTSMAYDARGRQDIVDGPLAGTADTTKYRWDSADQLIGVTDPDPDGAGALKMRAVRNTYRLDGQLAQQEIGTVTDQSDTAWSNFATAYLTYRNFNANARVERDHIWANGVHYAVRDYVYDGVGRVSCSVTKMDPNNWGAQATTCAPWQVNGPFGPDQVVQTVYDAASQPTQLKLGVGTADAATERTLTYSYNGLVNTLLDGENNKTTYVYDGFDRLFQTQYPSATKGSGTSNASDYEQLTYDANSNVTQYRARSSGTIGYTYDNLDRLVSKSSGGAADNYTYDLLDRRMTALSGQGITDSYDALSRLTSSTNNVGGTSRTMSYLYDLAGRRTRVTWWDGAFVDYDRLVTGELSKVREQGHMFGVNVLATYGYDDLRRRRNVVRGNGTVTSWDYDAVSRLTQQVDDLAGTADDLTLTFATNPASQITSTTRSNDAYAYTGSANTNTTSTSNGLNQVLSSTTGGVTTNFGYDNNGNLNSDGSKTYSYDVENLMTSWTLGGVQRYLSYDPLNRLETNDPTGNPRKFINDGDQIAAELDNTGTIVGRYVYGDAPDEQVAWYSSSDPNSRNWVHQDERGSVIGLSDASGAAVLKNRYDEYGNPQSGNAGRFGYTGQAWLPEIGLHYYKNRMYKPGIGFMQTDPIGYAGGANLYAYVLNDPINLTDPLGLQPCGPVCPPPEPGSIVVVGRRPPGGGAGGGGAGSARGFQPRMPGEGGSGEQCPANGQNNGFLPPPAATNVSTGAAVEGLGLRLLGIVGLALSLGGDTPKQREFTLRHYTNRTGYESIVGSGYIAPISGYAYFTPDYYRTGSSAQASLALRRTPVGYFSVSSNRVIVEGPPTRIEPANGQPGGGRQVRTRYPVPVARNDWTPICQ